MLQTKVGPVVKGALSFVPGIGRVLSGSGGATASASYCYGVWLKHLVMLHEGSQWANPRTVAELGPGTSLGTGLAAMLCGADRYIGLDVVAHADTAVNLRIFDELVELLRERAARPVKGWPDFDSLLDARLFPGHILDEARLVAALDPARVARLRAAVLAADAHAPPAGKGSIEYVAPWRNAHDIEAGCADLVLSHAVLGQVDNPEAVYRAMYAWLRPGGLMSHQIDFSFPGFNGYWNGYWKFSERMWKLIRGRRPFTINRLPSSAHLDAMAQCGFEVLRTIRGHADNGLPRASLASRWRDLDDEDLRCSNLFVVARKPGAN